jgi:membrane-associated phospholipid phosphatase
MNDSPRMKSKGSARVVLILSGAVAVLVMGVMFDLLYDTSFVKALEPYERMFDVISLLGLGWTQVLVIVAMFFYSRKSRLVATARRALRGASISGAVAYVLGGVLTQVVKHLVGRPRPYMDDPWGFIGPTLSNRYRSFPSGHTTTSFALAFVLGAYFPRWRWVFYGLAGLVGFSRIALEEHYPLDVAGGVVLGLLCGWLAVKWFERKQRCAEK